MNTYVVSPSASGENSAGRYIQFIKKHHIALMGWSLDDPNDKKGIGRLFYDIPLGSLIIIAYGKNTSKKLIGAGFVDGESKEIDEDNVLCAQGRHLTYFCDLSEMPSPFSIDCKYGDRSGNWIPSCYQLSDNEADQHVVDTVLKEINIHRRETQMKELCQLLERCHNLILTGAPGTGKTYLAKQIACEITGDTEGNTPHIAFVQFHPSYDYTDFVEGLRPTPTDKDDSIGFERRDGVFKEFCKAAIARQKSNFDDAFSSLRKELAEKGGDDNSLQLETEKGTPFRITLNSRGNLSLITGGSNQIQGSLTAEKLKSFLTDDPYEYWGCYFRGVIRYLEKEHHLATSKEPSDQKYVFIIDEINRGDIAKIFGELFFAIDPGYRSAKNRVPVKTQYQTLIRDPKDPFVEGFYVPENVYIIATMNDIDRNVESMDFAIRRRFTWREVSPEETVYMLGDKEHGIPEYEEIAVKYMATINALIKDTPGLGRAYQIGASYFLKLRDYNGDFSTLWSYHIAPLLREYLRGLPNAEKDFANLEAAWNSVNQPQDTAQ